MSGAGNDFILFDTKINPGLSLSADGIKRICARRTGIGADGVIFISDDEKLNYRMRYFNADGSTGSLCANGARCSLYYAKNSGRMKENYADFECNGFLYSGETLENGKVRFNLNKPKDIKSRFKIKAGGQLITASYADTGSPHTVILINDISINPADPKKVYENINDVPVFELGREIRNHPDFSPAGTNVMFIDISGKEIKIRSYERGVEDETLACGTGSVAAAVIAFLNYNFKPPIELLTKSGDILTVDFNLQDKEFDKISLTGPAEVTFNGEIYI